MQSFIFIDAFSGQDKRFFHITNTSIYIPVVYIIPFIILILINISIIRGLTHYYDEHRRLLYASIRQMAMLNANFTYSRRHYHVTIMHIAIVLLFLICRCPMLIKQIYEVRYSIGDNDMLKSLHYFRCRARFILDIFANFMQIINPFGNLIIYLLFYQHFRETAKNLVEKVLICLRLHSNENPFLITYQRSRGDTRSTNT